MIARDAGGNERHALFSIDATGGSELRAHRRSRRDPRPGRVLARRHAGRVHAHRPQRRRLRRRRRRASTAAGGSELAQPGGWSHVVDWSEHGILVQRANTPFDHDLFLVDPESGDAHATSPRTTARSPTTRRACCADGAVLCACDAGSEFARLALLRDGAEPEFLTPDDADVEIVALDAARARRAWVVNRGGESEVWLDGERVEGLPGGVVSALAFAPDGSLTVTAGPPDDSTDVWTPRPPSRRRTRSAVGGLDRSGFVRPGARGRRELRRPPHPVPALRPGGAPRAVLGARRARVAVPAADGAR